MVVGLSLLLILWLGLRPASFVFGDTVNYARSYSLLSPSALITEGSEWVFYSLMGYCKEAGLSVNVFFLIIETCYISGLVIACEKAFKRSAVLIPFVVTLASFSFFSYAVNGLRQGMACALMLAVLASLKEPRNWVLAIVLSFLAFHIHTSTLLIVAAAVGAYFYSNTKVYLSVWIVCLVIGAVASGTTEAVFSNVGLLDTGKNLSYYDNDSADLSQFSVSGFRYDFMLYGIVPILVGAYAVLKQGFADPWYKLLLNVYLITNSFWALVNQSWLSNRVAYLSWCSYGLVLTYPFVMAPYVEDRKKKIAYVLLGNAAFSYVMWLIGKYM